MPHTTGQISDKMEQEKNQFKLENFYKDRPIQDYISLGYLYLLCIGLIKDTIQFMILDLSYLQFATVTDILLSPIEYATQNWKMPIAFILFIGFTIYLVKRDKKANTNALISFVVFMVLSFYLGTGIGAGFGQRHKINKEELQTNYEITFSNDAPQKVRVVRITSQYIFYVTPENRAIQVAPIASNIKTIRKLPKEDD